LVGKNILFDLFILHNDIQHNDIHHNDTQHNDIHPNTLIIPIKKRDTQHKDTKNCYAECHLCRVSQISHCECRFAECHYAECRGASRFSSAVKSDKKNENKIKIPGSVPARESH
jgi:hypothetical protein